MLNHWLGKNVYFMRFFLSQVPPSSFVFFHFALLFFMPSDYYGTLLNTESMGHDHNVWMGKFFRTKLDQLFEVLGQLFEFIEII